MRLLEEELRREHDQQNLRRANTKPAKPNTQNGSIAKLKPSRHQLSSVSESDEEMSVAEDDKIPSANDVDNPFDQAAAEYAQQNPQEARLASKKSSPFVSKSKQYTSRRKKQEKDKGNTEATETSDNSCSNHLNDSRPKKQPTNTGKMNALVADLSETEAVGRRQKKGNCVNNDTALQASEGTVGQDDVDTLSKMERPAADPRSKKKNPLADCSNSAVDSRPMATKGVFDEVFADELEESDDAAWHAAAWRAS